jgi:hypothetical protein
MPVQVGSDDKGCYARWGDAGHKYYYKCGSKLARKRAKKKALAQAVAIGEFDQEKISFDFDDTLSKPSIQRIAKRYVEQNIPVYVISAKDHPDKIYPISDKVGIPRYRVYATGSNTHKIEMIKKLHITKHYDNNKSVIDKIGEIGELVPLSQHQKLEEIIKFIENDDRRTEQ